MRASAFSPLTSPPSCKEHLAHSFQPLEDENSGHCSRPLPPSLPPPVLHPGVSQPASRGWQALVGAGFPEAPEARVRGSSSPTSPVEEQGGSWGTRPSPHRSSRLRQKVALLSQNGGHISSLEQFLSLLFYEGARNHVDQTCSLGKGFPSQ